MQPGWMHFMGNLLTFADRNLNPKEPRCKLCGDTGVIWIKRSGPPACQTCSCQRDNMLVDHISSRWYGLLEADKLGFVTPLAAHLHQNLWLTVDYNTFRPHFRGVAIKAAFLDWKVIRDGALADSQWSDKDKSEKTEDLLSLTTSPDLLVILLGGCNKPALPGLLSDAIGRRQRKAKFTWIIDSPQFPFQEGHAAWSPLVGGILNSEEWKRAKLKTTKVQTPGKWASLPIEEPHSKVETIDPMSEGDESESEREPAQSEDESESEREPAQSEEG